MADISDVEDALVIAIDAVRQAQSATWNISRGQPAGAELDAAMKAGVVVITVFERDGYGRITTRFPQYEADLPRLYPTLTVAVAGNVVTFGGTCSVNQTAGIKTSTVETSLRCVAADTPATIASRFALTGVGTASGATITVPMLVTALVGRDQSTLRPTRQQDVGIVATIWAPDPKQRDDVAREIDSALSDDQYRFLPLSDGSRTWVRSAGARQSDRAQVSSIYRQDLYFLCEFSTTIVAVRPVVLFPNATIKGSL